MNAIRVRLLVAASLVLAAFLVATALALERAHRAAALTQLQARLEAVIYTILAAAEEDDRGRMLLPETLPEPRLSRPDSDLQAWVLDGQGALFWRSTSLLGRAVPPLAPLPAGERRFEIRPDRLVLAQGIAWEDDQGRAWPFTLAVSQARAAFEAGLDDFRQTLRGWLLALAVGLLTAQLLVLRWGLAPLGRARRELDEIHEGARSHLSRDYPAELRPLAEAVNRLLDQGRAAQNRYRHALDDLAHALKTPLACLQSLAEESRPDAEELQATVREQLAQMRKVVDSRLTRAAAVGRSGLEPPIGLARLVGRLAAALEKVHGGRGVRVQVDVPADLRFHGPEGDLMELLGNLLDNACKYGNGRVWVRAACHAGRLELTVDDDGPGIPPDQREVALRRGTRLDSRRPGQGLGLPAAEEIAAALDGALVLESAPTGGLRVRVKLPGCSRAHST